MPTRSEREAIACGEIHSVVRNTLRHADRPFDVTERTDENPGLNHVQHHETQGNSGERRGSGLGRM